MAKSIKCCLCGDFYEPQDLSDQSYRIGDTETIVYQWACAECEQEWYDAAMANVDY